MLLNSGPGAVHERDLQLLHRSADLNDAELKAALKHFLDRHKPAYLDFEFHGLCLVGFNCDAYLRAVAAMRHPERS